MQSLARFVSSSLWLVAFFALVALVGCGDGHPKTYPVSGKVTVNGKPVATGDIMLIPEKGRAAGGPIVDGRFQLTTFDENDGAPKGTYKVVVTGDEPYGKQMRTTVPDRYSTVDGSDKTVTIDGPIDALVIELNWGSERPRVYR